MRLIADKIEIVSASIQSASLPHGFVEITSTSYIRIQADGLDIAINGSKDQIESILASIKINQTVFEVNESL